MRRLARLLLCLALLAAGASGARGQANPPLPTGLEGVGITEHLDARIPLDLTFNDETGTRVALASYFVKGRPVILTLNYYSCPMLCTFILNGLTDAMRQIPWLPGREFEVVTVSFDPTETSALAGLKKKSYLDAYGRPGAGEGWHFLTGEEANIHALTEAVGFRYKWDDEQKQFAHAAAIFILTPDGRISRYLYGVQFEPKDLRLALIEASSGKIGSPIDQILMYCYHYDAKAGRYAIAAQRIMKAGGILTVLVLGGWLFGFWLRERSRGHRVAPRPQP